MKLNDYLRKKAQARKQGKVVASDKAMIDSITDEDLENDAESEIVRTVQREAFGRLQPGECVSKRSALHKLDVSVNDHGIIRVGGRLMHAQLSQQTRHPIVIPKSRHVTQLIIRHFHERCFHQGKSITLNTLRTSGYWVINAASQVGRMMCYVVCVM